MGEKIKVEDAIASITDGLKLKPSEFNGRVARSVMLYNQNYDADSGQLRFRKARPIKAAMCVVNALLARQNYREYNRSEDIKKHAMYFYRLFYNSGHQEAKIAVEKYYPRMIDFGMIDSFGTSIQLTNDFDEKILYMLADSRKISTNNTYFKAMALTTSCAAITEKHQWEMYPEEICENAFEVLKDIGLISVNQPASKLMKTHIEPLHVNNGVEFYFDNSSKRLGIPATAPCYDVKSAYANIGKGDDTLSSSQKTTLINAINDLLHYPIVSASHIFESYEPFVYRGILQLQKRYPEDFPLIKVPLDDGGVSTIFISRSRIEQLRKITNGNMVFSELMLDREPAWTLAAFLFNEAGKDGGNIVHETISTLIKDHQITGELNRVQRKILGLLWDRGKVVELDEKGNYQLNNPKLLGIINSVFDIWLVSPGIEIPDITEM